MDIVILLSCIFILLGVGIGYLIIDGAPKAQARALQDKFVSLGDVRGKTYAQIVAVVGNPKSRSVIDGNVYSCSWNTQKYYITLQFNGDTCEGITSEISV